MTEEPDVEIAATVRAGELRFECEPEVSVRVHANEQAWADESSKRRNLPERVEPGVTYRDIEVAWHVWARLRDPDF